uniref:type 1 fimbrial protein n=1 Tax=Serratia marcescens TaxID=615 RepID=UPI0011E687BB
SATHAETRVNGGVIHFVGAVVEDPCNIANNPQRISMSCYRDGQMQTSKISYRQAFAGTAVNNDMATVSLQYINPQKTLGVLTVNYR